MDFILQLKDLTQILNHTGNNNPTIWLLEDTKTNESEAFPPSNVFIDNQGDIIIQFNPEMIY